MKSSHPIALCLTIYILIMPVAAQLLYVNTTDIDTTEINTIDVNIKNVDAANTCWKCYGGPLYPTWPPTLCQNLCFPSLQACGASCKPTNYPNCHPPVGACGCITGPCV
jgi:hypothetical protein